MRLITSAADRLLTMVVPRTTAGACHCAYSYLQCACKGTPKYKYVIRYGNCVGCPPACGCLPNSNCYKTSTRC